MSTRVRTLSDNALTPAVAPARGTLQRKCACGNHSSGGACRDCSRKREGLLQRQAPGGAVVSAVPSIVHQVLSSPGQQLDAETRSFFESRFGADFSHVRVHTGEEASRSARASDAVAYAVGNHVVLGGGPISLRSADDRRLLAHELAHTLQQKGGALAAPTTVSDPTGPAERAADVLAERVMSGTKVRPNDATSAQQGFLFRIPVPGSGSTSTPGVTSPPTRSTTVSRPVPPRGSNPANCIEAVCRLEAGSSAPSSDAEAIQRVDDWERLTAACVRADGPGSNASHQAEIVTNEVTEISAEATELRVALRSLGRSRR